MKRTGRRYTEDFLEENNEEIVYEDFELESEKTDESEYQYFDFTEDESFDEIEEKDEKKSPVVLKKIGKILIVILVLIALFFASAKITEIILDRNEEPATFGNETPDFEEDFNEIIEEDEPNVDNEIPEVLGNEVITEPEVEDEPEAEEPAPQPKPEPSPTPAPAPNPEPTPEPEPAPAPSPAPKPSITPGNPAA